MKRFLALAIAVGTVSAEAASDRAIYDIMYLPNNGTTYGISELAYVKQDIQGKNGATDIDVKGMAIVQTIGHSLTDKFSVELSMNYIRGKADPDTGTSVDQKGLSDPTATGRFRLIDDAIKLDLIGGVMLSLGESKYDLNSSSEITDVDNRQGGNAVFGAVQVGEKLENLQWAVAGGLRRNFERENDYDGTEVKFKSNNDVLVQADLLNKLGEVSYLRSNFQANFVEALKNKTSGYSSLSDAPETSFTLGTQYQHLLSQNLMLKGGVDYVITNSDSGNRDSDRSWIFLVGANYQF